MLMLLLIAYAACRTAYTRSAAGAAHAAMYYAAQRVAQPHTDADMLRSVAAS